MDGDSACELEGGSTERDRLLGYQAVNAITGSLAVIRLIGNNPWCLGHRRSRTADLFVHAIGCSVDKAALYSFMKRARYGVISSLAADRTPQSVLIAVAITHDFEIVFDTLTNTRKNCNLLARAACSVVLWGGGEQTVQIDGNAFEATGAVMERYREVYFDTWPDGRNRLSWVGITHLVVRPRWIRAIDFDHSPPMIERHPEPQSRCRIGRSGCGS